MELSILILELIGTVAFAVSGATVGIKNKMDILGVVILGLTTAVGGGIIRDLILGNTPPVTFRDPKYAILAIITSVIVFIPAVRGLMEKHPVACDKVLLVMDSLGLGIFTVIGIRTAFSVSYEANTFLAVFVGVITGVGGGVVRDIMADDTPYIFVKHIYACAALVGAAACALLWNVIGSGFSLALGAVLVFVIRLCAAHFRWSLPKA